MLRYLQFFTILFVTTALYCQPLLKTPIASDNAFTSVCSSSDFPFQGVNIKCGNSFVPELLVSNIYKEFKWTFGNGITYIGYNCPNQFFNKVETYNNKLTITSEDDFTVLKSIKINYTNDNWYASTDTSPDYYLDFFLNNIRVLQSCYKSDKKAPVLFTLPDGYIMEKDTKIEIYDYDPLNSNDYCATFILPKNANSQTISSADAQIEIVTQKTKSTTLDFKVNIFSTASISVNKLSCDQAILTASEGNSYKWSTGATSKSITVGPGDYAVTVSSNGNCTASDNYTFKAITFAKPLVDCFDKYLICSNFSNLVKWLDENKNPIVGANNQLFLPTKPGTYYAEYLGGDSSTACRFISDGYKWPECSMISNTNEFDENVTIYPNPTSSNLFLKGLLGQSCSLEIINSTGKTVKMMDSVDDNTIINIDDLPDGMYFVKLSDKGKPIKIQKIIKIQ